MTLPLVLELLVILADEVSADASLEVGDDLAETFVSHVFESSEDAGLEEDLGVTETVVILIELQRIEHFLSDHLPVDEARGNHVRRQDRIPADINVLVFKCLHGLAPAYLADYCQPTTVTAGRTRLRSANTQPLAIPRTNTG